VRSASLALAERSEWAELRRLIDELPRGEREIVRRRLGLDRGPSSPVVAGRAADLSRQRLYELALEALRRLHQAYAARLLVAATERPTWSRDDARAHPEPLRRRRLPGQAGADLDPRAQAGSVTRGRCLSASSIAASGYS
jgi:hypothetical protein